MTAHNNSGNRITFLTLPTTKPRMHSFTWHNQFSERPYLAKYFFFVCVTHLSRWTYFFGFWRATTVHYSLTLCESFSGIKIIRCVCSRRS